MMKKLTTFEVYLMRLSDSAYAIEPSDSRYFDQLDKEHREEEAKEDFTKTFIDNIAKPWHFLNRMSESHCYKFFDDALQAIYDSAQKSTAFNHALHLVWSNPCCDQYSKQISEMIEQELMKIAEKEFNKNPDLFYW